MKKENMRKSLSIGAAVLLAFGLLLASCDTGSGTASSEEAATGFTGIYSGFVVDSVTGQPLSGVTVSIGGRSVATDDVGSYIVRGIPAGQHIVGFSKEGYRFVSRDGATVDVQTYKNADPFGEWNMANNKLTALVELAKSMVNLTTLTVDGDNGAVLTITGEDSIFKYEQTKIDSAWEYEYPLYVTTLAPLTGSVKGNISLVDAIYNEAKNKPIDDAKVKSIGEGVDVWFEESGFNVYPGGNGGAAVSVATKYGPVKTTAEGTFEISGLPANTGLTLKFASFTRDGYYYAGTNQYQYSYTARACSHYEKGYKYRQEK